MTMSRKQTTSVVLAAAIALALAACSSQPVSEDDEADVATAPVAGRPKDLAEHRQFAAQGFVDSQYRMGLWYEEDHPGSPRDMVRAYAWYKLAANQGDFGSKYALERFEAQLTHEERFRADELVERWKPGDTLEK